MTHCWAEILGDCSDKISKEHIISEGMFPGLDILVNGFSWCREAFKEIRIETFVKRILCEHHNHALRVIDNAGIDAMKAFRDEVQITNARKTLKPIRWTVKKFQIDGRGLERWCLKTLINVAAEGEYKIGRDSNTAGQPSARLVRIAFGKENFKPKAGLYGVGDAGENWNIKDGVRLQPYVDKENTAVGGLFVIHGYRYFLYLEEEGVSSTLTIPGLDGEADHPTQTLYPLKRINFNIGKHLSHVFDFRYPG
jgi:hypothetical protein